MAAGLPAGFSFRVHSRFHMLQCCCNPDCFCMSNRECHLSLFALPLKNKRLVMPWVHIIRRANFPLNCHPWICSTHFVKAEGRRLCPDGVQMLSSERACIYKLKQQEKEARYRPARLGDQPVTIVGTTVRSWHEPPPTGTSIPWGPWSCLSQPANSHWNLRT